MRLTGEEVAGRVGGDRRAVGGEITPYRQIQLEVCPGDIVDVHHSWQGKLLPGLAAIVRVIEPRRGITVGAVTRGKARINGDHNIAASRW
jgi:hypothetical protein